MIEFAIDFDSIGGSGFSHSPQYGNQNQMSSGGSTSSSSSSSSSSSQSGGGNTGSYEMSSQGWILFLQIHIRNVIVYFLSMYFSGGSSGSNNGNNIGNTIMNRMLFFKHLNAIHFLK